MLKRTERGAHPRARAYVMASLLSFGALACEDPKGSAQADVSGGELGGEVVGGVPLGGEPVGGEPVGGEPVGGEPIGEEPVGGELMGGESVGGEPIGGEPVGGEPVGGEPVGGEPVGGEPMSTEGLCGEARADERRLVAVSFPFSDTVGIPGEVVGLFWLDDSGSLTPWGERLELGFKAKRLRFSRDGWWLLALGERGELASIDLREASPQLTSSLTLTSGAYRGVQHAVEERSFDLIDGNSQPSAGLSSLSLGCEGELEAREAHSLRLMKGFQRLPKGNEGLIFGGQALFEPIDLIDVRWVREVEGVWRERVSLDVYQDSIDAFNLGLSPTGEWAALVNGSPFSSEGGQVRFVRLSEEGGEEGGEARLEERERFEGLGTVRGAWFLPSGRGVLVTQAEENAVQTFELREGAWQLGQRLSGIGLAEDLALTRAAPSMASADEGWWALVPFTSPSGGAGLELLHTFSDGSVTRLPALSFGAGFENIPGAISAWPEVK